MRYDWFIFVTATVMFILTASLVFAETNTVSSTVVNNTPPTANAPVIPNSNSDIL